MVAPALAAVGAGGLTILTWKTSTLATRWALVTVVVSIVYDDVVAPSNDFGVGDLAISAAVAGVLMGVFA